MLHCIARICEPLLRLWAPAHGRHRPPEAEVRRPSPPLLSVPPRPRRLPEPVLRGEDIALVRPYLVAHERREEARLQRARRRALWFAVHGVDIGPRLVHGVEVAA